MTERERAALALITEIDIAATLAYVGRITESDMQAMRACRVKYVRETIKETGELWRIHGMLGW